MRIRVNVEGEESRSGEQKRKKSKAATARFRGALDSLREGTLRFSSFMRITRPDYERMAKMLMRRWRAPEAVELEDVIQELLLETSRRLPLWDPERQELADYVVFNICTAGKRWLHAQRNAHRRDDRSPSRIETPISRVWKGNRRSGEAEERLLDRAEMSAVWREEVETEIGQEEIVEGRRLYAKITSAMPGIERELFDAVLEERGSVDRATDRVYANGELCLRLSAGDRATVARAMRGTLRHAIALAEV